MAGQKNNNKEKLKKRLDEINRLLKRVEVDRGCLAVD